MRKRRLLIPALVLTVALALAQDVPAQLNLDVRLAIVESRLGRLESDVALLARIPEQLSRIEERVTAIADKTSGNSGVLQTVGLGIVMSVVTGLITFGMGKRSK